MRGSVVTTLICSLAFAWSARAEAPVAVSPGSAAGTRIADSCPTFSWSAVASAAAYELVVYRIDPAAEPTEVFRRTIHGAALSWTPALDECLPAGDRFGWTVRARGAGGPSAWAEAALFEVALEPGEARSAAAERRSAVSAAEFSQPGLLDDPPLRSQVVNSGPPATVALSAHAPLPTAAGAAAPFSVSRADGGFLVAEFLNRAGSGDRSAVVDVSNGNGTSTTWRFGVGGAGNGFGLTDGQFYLERVGAGLALQTNGVTTRLKQGYPTLLAELEIAPLTSGCGVLCGRTGQVNSSAVGGQAEASGGIGVAGQSNGANGRGVEGAATASGGVGVRGVSTTTGAVAGEFELIEIPGDLLIGKVQTDPVFRVDHTGKGFFDGGTQTGGADFAESMDVAGERGDYAPGDVMMIDPTGRRRLRRAVGPYSIAVAGVVSARPGVLATPHRMGSPELETEIPLAVVGIVPCKVSTENGAIRPGDLLVTSSTPGHAMRGSRRKRMLGAVLGKALEPFERGTGTIEVLVMLQ